MNIRIKNKYLVLFSVMCILLYVLCQITGSYICSYNLIGIAEIYKCEYCGFAYVESNGRTYPCQHIPIYIKHYYGIWPTNCIHKFDDIGLIHYDGSLPKIIDMAIRYNWWFILLSIAGVLLIIFQKIKKHIHYD
jgi:hypothetical protein